MKTNETEVNDIITQTRQPDLTMAVYNQLGCDSADEFREVCSDICSHGMEAGFGSFIYTKDCAEFFTANRDAIIGRIKSDYRDCGCESVVDMIKGFNCLKNAWCDEYEFAAYRLLSGGHPQTGDEYRIAEVLAWYAAEEVAREIVDI